MPEPWKSRNTQGNDEAVPSTSAPRENTSRGQNGNPNRGGWRRRNHWKPRGRQNGGRHWEDQPQAEGSWGGPPDSWNKDTSFQPDTPDPWASPEAAWNSPQPEPKEPETFEELLKAQAHMHSDFIRDLIPFYLKTVEAAEKEEPEVKLEAYLEEMIQKRKASGWYWSLSDSAKKDGDGWSDHRASNNGWGVPQDNGWGDPCTGHVEADGPGDWGDTQRDKGWGDYTPQNDGWGAANPHEDRHLHGGRGRGAPKPGRGQGYNKGNWRTG